MQTFLALLNAVTRVSACLAALCIGVVAVSYAAEVVARYGLASPLNWSGDTGSYMLCSAVFLALPQIARNRAHVSISILVDILPGRVRGPYVRLLMLVTAMALIAVSWFIVQICLSQFRSGVLTPMSNQIPRWWLTSLMAFGLILSAVHFIFPQAPEPSAAPIEV